MARAAAAQNEPVGSLPPLPALSVDALWARYPGQAPNRPALAGISVQVGPGERLLLLGPNGAGKSTLIRICAGLMRPTAGSVRILGQPPRRARSLVGVVAHATYLYPELSAEENLRLYGDLYGVADPRQRAADLLQWAGLRPLASERVGRLSRGQQQRLALARALVHRPPLLLLDEPDTGLDAAAFDLLEEAAVDPGRSVLVTTHNLGAGLRLGTRVLVLAGGRQVHEQDGLAAADGPDLAKLLHDLAAAPAAVLPAAPASAPSAGR